jgi:hypothetical protein
MAAVGRLTKGGRGLLNIRLLAGDCLAALRHHDLDGTKKGGVSFGGLWVSS